MSIELHIEQRCSGYQKELMLNTHRLLCDQIPNLQATIKWNTPCYVLTKNFCYLNTFKDHIYLGFMESHLYREIPKLQFDKKLIAKLYVTTIDKLFTDDTQGIVLSCAEIFLDDQRKRKNKPH